MSSNVSAAHRIEPASSARDYVDAIEAALFGALREVGPTLAEPHVTDVDRALRVLDDLVAAYTGFALGLIARHVLTGMRRWFGDDGVATVRAAMRGWPLLPPRIDTATLDRERPLAGGFLAKLHVRCCHAVGQARRLVEDMPDRPMVRMMFSVLAQDTLLARRLAEELARGWAVYTSAVTTRRHGALTPLWQEFLWRLDGRPVQTRDETTEAGYITLVR